MYRNRSPQQIVQQWHDDVEQNMEAGTAPVVELGACAMLTDDVASVLAVQRWTASRSDVTAPLLPCGGTGAHWLAALLRPLSHHEEAAPPQATVVYGGSNEAEYLLTSALLYAATDMRRPSRPLPSRRSAIPASYFAPHSQPGMSLTWDSQPFLTLQPAPAERPVAASMDNAFSEDRVDASNDGDDPLPDWLAWAGLLLALFLVLLSILL